VFTGPFVQSAGGRLLLAVGDVLRGADIALGGLLRIEGSDATLQPGARIEVVRATGSRTGTFATVESVPARRLGVEYGPSVVALVVEPPETHAPTDQPPSSSPPASSCSSPGLKAVRLTGATCIRSGRIRLRLRVPSGAGLRRAIVHRSGRRVAVLGPRMVRRSLTLRVRGRRAVIRVTLIGAGERRALVRRYRRCA
jgi:hypothetical protein